MLVLKRTFCNENYRYFLTGVFFLFFLFGDCFSIFFFLVASVEQLYHFIPYHSAMALIQPQSCSRRTDNHVASSLQWMKCSWQIRRLHLWEVYRCAKPLGSSDDRHLPDPQLWHCSLTYSGGDCAELRTSTWWPLHFSDPAASSTRDSESDVPGSQTHFPRFVLPLRVCSCRFFGFSSDFSGRKASSTISVGRRHRPLW